MSILEYNKPSKSDFWKPETFTLDHLIRIGTAYGGWVIPDNLLTKNSICYLAGAGEDISFDIGLVEKYHCNIFIIDPTPRAKTHFETLVTKIRNNQKMEINNSNNDYYKLSKKNLKLLNFWEIGLWNDDTELNFYEPKNPLHVSHSALNLQQTDRFFKAEVKRLATIMKINNHQELDLLKIDIEGAEYNVINSIIKEKIKIKVLCVEYDEAFNPLDDKYLKRIEKSVKSLLDFGYKIVEVDSHHNYTFIRNDVFNQL